MLNPKLNLNPNLFDEKPKTEFMRDGYGKALLTLGEAEPNVVALTADLAGSTRVEEFRAKYPERFIECGVAEQNMAGIASGLAVSGKIPFMSSFGIFSPGKNWETIRTTIVHNKANVKIAGHYAGIASGANGATHQATEDIAITRVWPGIKVFSPCDSQETYKVTVASAYLEGPVYLRFSPHNSPTITTDKTLFDPNKTDTYWTSEKPRVAIFATGYMVYNALVAAKKLEEEQITVLVLNVVNIKPLNYKDILRALAQTGAAVTAEDHQVAGGLGGAIAEFSAKEKPIPIEFIGLQDTFAESGTADELIKKYGLDSDSIITAVKKVLARKNSD